MRETTTQKRQIAVGDHVIDRDMQSGSVGVVMSLPGLSADEYRLDGGISVADVNEECPDTDPVIMVRYPSRGDSDLEGSAYAYPRSRLRVVAPMHDAMEDA